MAQEVHTQVALEAVLSLSPRLQHHARCGVTGVRGHRGGVSITPTAGGVTGVRGQGHRGGVSVTPTARGGSRGSGVTVAGSVSRPLGSHGSQGSLWLGSEGQGQGSQGRGQGIRGGVSVTGAWSGSQGCGQCHTLCGDTGVGGHGVGSVSRPLQGHKVRGQGAGSALCPLRGHRVVLGVWVGVRVRAGSDGVRVRLWVGSQQGQEVMDRKSQPQGLGLSGTGNDRQEVPST